MAKPTILRNSWGDIRLTWILSSGVLIILFVIMSALAISVHFGVRYGQINCRKFGAATERPVKFVRNSYWSWDCYTRDPANPNSWIPTGSLRETYVRPLAP